VSIRQQIVDALKARLTTIVAGVSVTDVNGGTHTYITDLGLCVQEWRRENLVDDEQWYVSVRDTKASKDPGEGSEIGKNLRRLTVFVDLVARDEIAPELIRAAILDLSVCVGVDPRLGGLCRWIDIDEENLEVIQTADLLAGSSLMLSVTYKTPLWARSALPSIRSLSRAISSGSYLLARRPRSSVASLMTDLLR